jgi:hypothetical protein
MYGDDGRFELGDAPGGGTVVTILIPFDPPTDAPDRTKSEPGR